MPEDSKAPPASRPTPAAIVGIAVMLWVLGCAFALFAVINLNTAPETLPGGEPDPNATLTRTYLMFAPSTIAILLGLVALVVGSVRWALYGAKGQGLKVDAAQEQSKLLKSMHDRLMVSETAKKVAFRVEDIRLLRTTIEEDIKRKEFDAAMALVKILADTYGRIEESEQFRERIEKAREEEVEQKVGHEVARLDEMLGRNDFARASRHAARIKRLFPTVDSVQEIDLLVRDAKELHKKDLERRFLGAAEKDDVAGAMELLKELDKFLGPTEAKQFEEVARGVIGKQRDNLGVQFKLAVHDKEWLVAVRVGEQIIRDFPNTRMADEVRGMLDLLRERSAGQQAAAL